MDYPEKLATFSTQDPDTQNIRTTQYVRHHHANKHKQGKQDMSPQTTGDKDKPTIASCQAF
jgi:3-mercaptopyruvate sulfurtransferase SseA